MRVELMDISLTELRDFIYYTSSNCQTNFGRYSLINLRLRLQKLLITYRFDSFLRFFEAFKNDLILQNKLIEQIIPSSNELFRDVESWKFLFQELKSFESKKELNILIVEEGNFTDLLTFYICKNLMPLANQLNLFINSTYRNIYLSDKISFSLKEFELGRTNFNTQFDNHVLDEFFQQVNNDFSFSTAEIKSILYELPENETEFYDLVIARNTTIMYNFLEHDIMFKQYIQNIKRGGIFFAGNKEGFKWCNEFENMSFKEKHIPVYSKR